MKSQEFNPHGEDLEAVCRKIMEWRMELIPYLRSAFAEYRSAGVPPFRALVLDHPDDPRLADIDDQYLVGDRMLVVPLFAGDTNRPVVLPQGGWCDYWSGQAIGGGVTLHLQPTLDKIPVYVKSGSVFPVGGVGLSTKDPKTRQITVRVYGNGSLPWILKTAESNWQLSWDAESKQGKEAWNGAGKNPYVIVRWQQMG
jgi:alpha-D-xyloside xylohydrolase